MSDTPPPLRPLSPDEIESLLSVLAEHTALDRRLDCSGVVEAIELARRDLHTRLNARTDMWGHASELRPTIAELAGLEQAGAALVEAIESLGPMSRALVRGNPQYVGGHDSFMAPLTLPDQPPPGGPGAVEDSARTDVLDRACTTAFYLRMIAAEERTLLESTDSERGRPKGIAARRMAWEMASIWQRLRGDPLRADKDRESPFARFVRQVGQTVDREFNGSGGAVWVTRRLREATKAAASHSSRSIERRKKIAQTAPPNRD